MYIKVDVIKKGMLIIVASILLATGCHKQTKPYAETVAFTVNQGTVYLDEMLYHVMLAELQGQLYASFLSVEENYWEMKNEDGSTMAEAMKEMAMENAIRYELFYQLALEKDYLLSEDEKKNCMDKAENIMLSVPEKQLETTQLTKEKIIQIQEKIALATRYYEDYLKQLEIDEESYRKKINVADYKQYDIQYIYAQKGKREELEVLLATAKKVEDITTLAKDGILSSGTLSFIKGENTFGEETNLEDEILKLAVGEVSGLIDTVMGHYIIKLIDDSSTTIYDTAVKEAANKALEEVFPLAYENLKKEHQIHINEKVWKPIIVGKMTI